VSIGTEIGIAASGGGLSLARGIVGLLGRERTASC